MNSGYVTGLFYSRDEAERAIDALHELGYRDDDISVMMSDATRTRDFAIDTGTKAAEGATTGGLVGGTLGGIAAGMTTAIAGVVLTGGLALPLVAGPIAAILAGIGAGGLTGGVIGALIGAGIPEKRAREIESGLERGGIMVGVTPLPEDRARVEEILGADAGTDMDTDTDMDVSTRSRMETGEVARSDYDYDATEVESDIPPRRVVP